MKLIDFQNEAGYLELSKPLARTSTVTGSAVDIRDYQGVLKITQVVGAITGTPTLDGKIQDSADGSTGWADVTGATFTQVVAADQIQSIGVDTRAVKRHIRYVGTIGGGSPNLSMAVHAVGQKQVI